VYGPDLLTEKYQPFLHNEVASYLTIIGLAGGYISGGLNYLLVATYPYT
jgi:hypothetical protein